MENKNEPIISRDDFNNMEGTIQRETNDIDIPEVDAKLDEKFGKQQFVGTSKMQTEAQKKEAKRRADLKKDMLANRLKKRRTQHYEPFGGREAIVQSFQPKEVSSIQKTQDAQTKKAQEVQKNQTPDKRSPEKSSMSTSEKEAKASALKAHFKTNKGRAKAAANKSMSKSKGKSK